MIALFLNESLRFTSTGIVNRCDKVDPELAGGVAEALTPPFIVVNNMYAESFFPYFLAK